MRELIPQLLWTGHARDARQVQVVLQAGIRAVVDLAIEESAIVFPREIAYIRLPLLDGVGNETPFLRAAVSVTAMLIAGRVPTLVACSGGMSRSPAIVAAALATTRCTSLDEAWRELTSGHLTSHNKCAYDVSPGLWAEIRTVLNAEPIQQDPP